VDERKGSVAGATDDQRPDVREHRRASIEARILTYNSRRSALGRG
jgi:hypothetical protein